MRVFFRLNWKVTTFVFKDINTSETREVTMTAQTITGQAVGNIKTFANGEVGYFQFNRHNAIAEKPLFDAFNTLAARNVKDLIIDMRYNPGGFLQMASQVAYMIAGAENTDGKIFEKTIFNDQHPTFNPITGERLEPVPFTDEFVGFAENPAINPGTPLPSLDLKRVFVLTTGSTCSASEAVINGLRGANIEVIQIGKIPVVNPMVFIQPITVIRPTSAFNLQGLTIKALVNMPMVLPPKTALAVSFNPCESQVVQSPMTLAIS